MPRSFRETLATGTKLSLLAAAAAGALACGTQGGAAADAAFDDTLLASKLDANAAGPDDLATSTDALDAGTYLLHPKGDISLCLDVAWASNKDGARVQVTRCNGNAAQQWSRAGNQWKVFGDKCLNVKGGVDKDGTRLQIWSCNEYDNNNLFTLSGSQIQWKKNTKLCVDVVDGAMRDGTEVQLWSCDAGQNNVNQLWRWDRATGGAATPAPTPAKPTPAPTSPAPNTGNQSSSSALVGPSPAGLDVAPYFWTWAQYGDYPVRTLKEGMSKVNLKSATVSFELSNWSCKPKGEFASMGDDIKAFRKAGNRVILSYGGATDNPPYLQKACGDAGSLASVIDGQMGEYTTHNLDFDIEGNNLGDTSSNNKLVDALVILQKKYSDLYVSYTLPVDAYGGLPSTAITLLKRNIEKGVRVSRVNLMTMDYGQMPPAGKTSADMVLGSVDATVGQLKKLYPQVPEKTIYHMVGICPLIGQNDPPGSGSFYYTVEDARKTVQYVKDRGVGFLSYWGLMRDRSGWNSSNSNHSNTPQKDFEFLNTFRSAQ